MTDSDGGGGVDLAADSDSAEVEEEDSVANNRHVVGVRVRRSVREVRVGVVVVAVTPDKKEEERRRESSIAISFFGLRAAGHMHV